MGPFDFNNVQATSGRIAILFTGNGSGNGWNMDDFTVELIPNCPSPVKNSVVVSPVTSNEATVTWIDNNPDHNSWTVYYKPSSADENSWLTAIASQNSVTLTGLTSLTEYQVYVVTNCSVTDDTPDATFTETFTTLPSCPVPTGLTISNILSSSADIYWVAGANESEWEIEYGLENFVHGSGTIVSTTTIPYPLQNLSPNTKYDVYVRAVCSTSENSEWSSKESFRTACDAFPLPLTENFDSYDDWYSPDCWKKFETPNVTGYAYIYGTYAYSGSKSLKIGTNYSSDYYGFIRLPLLDATSLSDLQISFKAMKSSGSSHPLQVCVSPDYESIANLTVIASIDTLTSSWTDVTVPFSGYTGTGMYIVIGVPSGYNESCTFWVDDVVVDYADTTPVVIITDPTVTTDAPTDITQTTAKLNGTIINPDNVTINTQGFEWKATNGGTYTGVSASGNPMSYTLTGLSSNMSITYRAFIVTANGPQYGQEVVFSTLPEDVPEPCDVPTGLTATDIQAESITINWDNAAVLRWNVQYGVQGGTLSSATASTNSYTISNLTPETTYQIQVQAVCEENNVSEWSAPISVTTLVGINSYLENSVTLYPNPAKEYVDVRVDGDVNVTGMEVYDVYGKVIRTFVGANNDSPIRINVSDLSAGMYFVRVTTDRGVVTKRFIRN